MSKIIVIFNEYMYKLKSFIVYWDSVKMASIIFRL
jgi:hypothetical protein